MISITNQTTGESATFELIRVDFSPEAIATEHPVEQGVDVVDHVQRRPLRFSAQVFVTASPVSPTPQPFAVEEAVRFFDQQLGQPLEVVIDGEGTFTNVVLEGVQHGRNNVDGRPFDLRFKQIRVAVALSVPIPPRMPAPVAQTGMPTEQDLGQQSTAPGTPTSALWYVRQGVDNLPSFSEFVTGLYEPGGGG